MTDRRERRRRKRDKDRKNERIKSPVLNLTKVAGGGGAIAGLASLTTFIVKWATDADIEASLVVTVLVAAIAAWAVVSAADMVARGLAEPGSRTIPMSKGTTARYSNEDGWAIVAVEPGASGSPSRYLLVKSGEDPTWANADEIRLNAPAAAGQ